MYNGRILTRVDKNHPFQAQSTPKHYSSFTSGRMSLDIFSEENATGDIP